MKTSVPDLVLALIQAGKLPVPAFTPSKPEKWADDVVTIVETAEKLLSEAKPQPKKAVDLDAFNRGLDRLVRNL